MVEVAKRETPEEMIALFNKIKENNLKSGQVRKITRKQQNKRSSAVIALDKAYGLTKHLTGLNFSSIQEDEKIKLLAELENLRNYINGLLS